MLAGTLVVSLGSACGTDRACTDVALECDPLYEPTFDAIYTRTLSPTCAGGGSSCHGPEGNRGGLTFADADGAYAALVTTTGDAAVVPGDAACSPLVVRLASTDASEQMPPGSPLAAAERCAIEQWIANGAKR